MHRNSIQSSKCGIIPKYGRLPNVTPDNLETLEDLVGDALAQTAGGQSLLRAFFAKAQLKL